LAGNNILIVIFEKETSPTKTETQGKSSACGTVEAKAAGIYQHVDNYSRRKSRLRKMRKRKNKIYGRTRKINSS
jgi:hypothetical protein